TVLLMAILIVSASMGDVLISKGMKEVGEIENVRLKTLPGVFARVLKNKNYILSIVVQAIAFGSFLALLSRKDLSFVVPTSALQYVLAVLGARFLLKERISGLRWIGTILVALGVALVCV